MGSVEINEVEIDYSKEEQYKPGLYQQTHNFLFGKLEDFCTLNEQANNITNFYNRICSYD